MHTRRVQSKGPSALEAMVFFAVLVDIGRDGVGRVRAAEQDGGALVKEEEEATARATLVHVRGERADAIHLAASAASAEQRAAEEADRGLLRESASAWTDAAHTVRVEVGEAQRKREERWDLIARLHSDGANWR